MESTYQYDGMPPPAYKFTGKERDAESGLDNFGARYFGSSLGRFMQVDPIWIKGDRMVDPQRLNLYSYVRNNPLKLTDPTGMDVKLGSCPGNMTTSMCEAAITDGLKKDDRSHVHFKEGNGKNGLKKGEVEVSVDKDYKSSSKNFTTLQTLANDHSGTARVDIKAPTDSYSIKTETGFGKNGPTYQTLESPMGQPSNGTGFDGYTFFPFGSNSPGGGLAQL